MNEEMKAVIEQAIRQYGGEEITEAQHKKWLFDFDLMLYQIRIKQYESQVQYYKNQINSKPMMERVG